MTKSMRIFNANTLFKLSLGIIVLTAAVYMIGFCLGSFAGRNDRKNTAESETVAEDHDEDAGSALTVMCGIVGFAVSLAITGTAVNLYYKVDGSKYARTIKHGAEKFCKSLVGSVLLSSATAVAVPLVIGVLSLATDVITAKDILPMVLISLGSSLLFNILIRPLAALKKAGSRTALLVISIAVVFSVISAVTIAASYIGYTASLISCGITAVIGAVGTIISVISSCGYIKKHWLFEEDI